MNCNVIVCSPIVLGKPCERVNPRVENILNTLRNDILTQKSKLKLRESYATYPKSHNSSITDIEAQMCSKSYLISAPL